MYASEVDPNAILGPYHGLGSSSRPPVITEAWFKAVRKIRVSLWTKN
jgi:hypothetical protein